MTLVTHNLAYLLTAVRLLFTRWRVVVSFLKMSFRWGEGDWKMSLGCVKMRNAVNVSARRVSTKFERCGDEGGSVRFRRGDVVTRVHRKLRLERDSLWSV